MFELDEVHWFIKRKGRGETRANTYIMTMTSRKPRQIVGYAVDNGVKSRQIQWIADSVGYAKEYCTDGCLVYQDVVFGGKHRQNFENKKDTHNIESSNADLRHYIAGLKRRSRCFFRSRETLEAVLSVFIDAYNKFGEARTGICINTVNVLSVCLISCKIKRFWKLPLLQKDLTNPGNVV